MYLVHDLFIIIVADGSAQFIVVHVWLAFSYPPEHGDSFWIQQFEFPVISNPSYDVGVLLILE